MTVVKKIYIVLLVICLVPCASAAWFNETSASLFTDVEDGLKELVIAFVGICMIISGIAVVAGWFGHNNSLFKKGVTGFGVIALMAVLYYLGTEIFDYFVDNYW